MDCRTSPLFVLALTLACAGCVTPRGEQGPQNFAGPAGKVAAATAAEPAAAPRKDRKGSGSVKVELAFATLREREAEMPQNKDNLEGQARLRDDARKAYEKVLKLDPNSVEAYRGLGRVYTRLGDHEHALATYQKATAKLPRSAPLWYDYGQCQNRRKQWPEAVQCFRKALEFEPDNRDMQKALGLTLARAGQFDQALAPLTRASGSARAHYYVARMQFHLGQDGPARGNLAVALHENPNLNDAKLLQAQLDAGPGGAPAGAPALATRGTVELQPAGN